jgi:hypothetical protein
MPNKDVMVKYTTCTPDIQNIFPHSKKNQPTKVNVEKPIEILKRHCFHNRIPK